MFREDFALDIDPKIYEFDYTRSPRPEVVSADAFAEAGVAALSGEKRAYLRQDSTEHGDGRLPVRDLPRT